MGRNKNPANSNCILCTFVFSVSGDKNDYLHFFFAGFIDFYKKYVYLEDKNLKGLFRNIFFDGINSIAWFCEANQARGNVDVYN